MELLLILIYVSLCVAIFKIFRIPVNEWSLSTAALGGIIGLGLLLLFMNYNHPYTKNARIFFSVTPVLPGVAGRVTEVPVEPNAQLKAGDILFRIDPSPYQYAVEKKQAELAEAEQLVQQLQSSLDQANAGADRARAQLELAQQTFDRQETLFEQKVVAQAALDTAFRNLEASRQTLAGAEAAAERARLAFNSNIDGVNTTVARITAELRSAEFDLAHTVTRAPGPGFVTQVGLRPGMYTMPVPLRPAMVFVNTGPRDATLIAGFQQNSLQRVKVGDEAEVAYDAVPGRVFKARVRHVIDAIPDGQLQPTGVLQDVGLPSGGRVLAVIDVEEDLSAYQIPRGAAAQVAIYTEHVPHLSLLRKILLRMRSWENFVFTEGH
jgi:multidrug resistance efflux pump